MKSSFLPDEPAAIPSPIAAQLVAAALPFAVNAWRLLKPKGTAWHVPIMRMCRATDDDLSKAARGVDKPTPASLTPGYCMKRG